MTSLSASSDLVAVCNQRNHSYAFIVISGCPILPFLNKCVRTSECTTKHVLCSGRVEFNSTRHVVCLCIDLLYALCLYTATCPEVILLDRYGAYAALSHSLEHDDAINT